MVLVKDREVPASIFRHPSTSSSDSEAVPTPSFFLRDDRYWHISQNHYGLVGPRTPASVKGLCTSSVATCVAYVLHCPRTKRSALAHVAGNTDWMTLSPAFEFVVDSREGLHVDVAVFKGSWHASDVDDGPFAHGDAIVKLEAALRAMATVAAATVAIDHRDEHLEHGALWLERETGVVHVPIVPTTSTSPYSQSPFTISLENPSQHQVSPVRSDLGALEGSVLATVLGQPAPIWCVFDGSEGVNTLRLGAMARQVLIAYRRDPHGSVARFVELARDHRGVDLPDLAVAVIAKAAERLSSITWCEVCLKPAVDRCSSCNTVNYCNVEHQVADWKNHKAWCVAL